MKRLTPVALLLLVIVTTSNTLSNSTVETSPNPLIIMAHYCPWYHPINGAWEDGITGTPLLGHYDSNNQTTISQEINWAQQYGVTGFFIEWTGLKAKDFDDTLKIMLQNPDFTKVKFSLTYAAPMALGTVWEQNLPPGQADWSVNCSDPNVRATFLKDMEYAATNYFTRENFLKINGRPAIYIWATSPLIGDLTGMLQLARETTQSKHGFSIYFIGEELSWGNTPEPSRLKAFDAVMPYLMLNNKIPYNHSYPQESAIPAIIPQYRGWLNLCQDAGVGFIPSITPGYNDKNRTAYYQLMNGKLDTPAPIATRSLSSFKDYCSQARDQVDPDLNIIFISSWNEWFEGSTIEPSKGYGFDYLNVVKQTLAGYIPQTRTTPMNNIRLLFNKVARPSDISPPSTDSRLLAVAFDYIKLLDADNNTLTIIDLGTPEARQYLGLGWSGDETNWDRVSNYAWAGGDAKYANIYIKIPDNTVYLNIYATTLQRGTTMKVIFDNETIKDVNLASTWTNYTIPVGVGSITLEANPQNTQFNTSITITGTLNPAVPTTINIQYMHGGESKTLTTLQPGADGKYTYIFTPGTPGEYILTASCKSLRNSTVSTQPITLTVQKLSSSITCIGSKYNATQGDTIQLTGDLTPTKKGSAINIKLTKPDGQISNLNTTTGSNGSYTLEIKPQEIGAYTATAEWNGDQFTSGATSKPIRINMALKPGSAQGSGIPGYTPEMILVGTIFVTMLLSLLRRRKK